MIILFRANGITASRVNKYVDYYKSSNRDYKIVGWNRLGEKIDLPNYDFFNYSTGYVKGGFTAVWGRIRWFFFIFNYLRRYRKEVTTVHACDLDVALPSVLFKIIYKRDLNVIFDVCDWASASRGHGFLVKMLQRIERFTVNHSNHMIICEPERIHQIQFNVPIPVHVMRNIPSFEDVSFLSDNVVKKFENNSITVAYVGWFGNGRFIEELLNFSEGGNINLLIAGFGKESIVKQCEELQASHPDRVAYFGKVDYKYGLQIMNAADLIYAMYCKSIPNHFFAAPNKFYESMFLGKAILSTKGIPLEDKINEAGSGYAIEETPESLAAFFNNITKNELVKKGKDAHLKWSYYEGLTAEFMNKTYSNIIL